MSHLRGAAAASGTVISSGIKNQHLQEKSYEFELMKKVRQSGLDVSASPSASCAFARSAVGGADGSQRTRISKEGKMESKKERWAGGGGGESGLSSRAPGAIIVLPFSGALIQRVFTADSNRALLNKARQHAQC